MAPFIDVRRNVWARPPHPVSYLAKELALGLGPLVVYWCAPT